MCNIYYRLHCYKKNFRLKNINVSLKGFIIISAHNKRKISYLNMLQTLHLHKTCVTGCSLSIITLLDYAAHKYVINTNTRTNVTLLK